MNIQKLIAIFIAVSLNQSVFASECAIVSTVRVPDAKDVRQLVLVKHNGQRLSQPIQGKNDNFRAIGSRWDA